MLNVFRISFSLKSTYRANSIIYAFRQLPLIGKKLPVTLYESQTIKLFANVVSGLWELVSAFLGKFLYLGVMILLPAMLYGHSRGPESFVHIILCLTIVGTYLNTFMFNPTNDKYYAMVLMRMDGRQYAVSNYLYQIIKCVGGFCPCILILGMLIAKVPIKACILLPLYIGSAKVVATYCMLKYYKRTGIVCNENMPKKVSWIFTVFLLAAAYGLPAIGLALPINAFYIIALLVVLAGLYASRFIWTFQEYTTVYKELLANRQTGMNRDMVTKAVLEQNQKYISHDKDITSNKKGFEYFNDLFIKRHKKILWKSSLRTVFVLLVLIVGACGVLLWKEETRVLLNHIILTTLPFFVFVMYAINRGTVFTQALFMNCDHSMLTYSFYKKPEFILALFKIRLREIVKVNLLPAMVLATGLAMILWLSGGTDNGWNYVIIFVSIGFMSVFFSVHYLMCYYLLQPYNAKTEVKGVHYHIVTSGTYILCYMSMKIRMSTFAFGIAVTVFCVVYCIVACMLIYKFANRTFRIRV